MTKVVATWVPDKEIRYKVVSEGWGSGVTCPHCGNIALSVLVLTKEKIDIWWICDCGKGISIKQAYENQSGTHIHSLGYYESYAYKLQEHVWPQEH